ncbi:MAG: 8-oxo-dGTP diphosphatase [Clostridia bacterium]|nr:8-oxo-dGTP diphosphatase [Clostridia bacterium]
MKLGTLGYLIVDEKMLLLHRNKKIDDMHENKWIGLGGKIIPGESPEECIIREFREESGLSLKNVNLRGMITFPKFDTVEDWYVFIFTAFDYEGELIDCNEGTLEWVPLEEVMDKPTWKGDLIFLEWLLTNQPFFSGKFLYDDSGFVDYEVKFY